MTDDTSRTPSWPRFGDQDVGGYDEHAVIAFARAFVEAARQRELVVERARLDDAAWRERVAVADRADRPLPDARGPRVVPPVVVDVRAIEARLEPDTLALADLPFETIEANDVVVADAPLDVVKLIP